MGQALLLQVHQPAWPSGVPRPHLQALWAASPQPWGTAAVVAAAGGVWAARSGFCGAAVQAVRNMAIIRPNKSARGRCALHSSAFAYAGRAHETE